MVNIPPTFKFKGDKNKSISLKSQALQFCNHVIKQAEVGGIPFINRSLILPDGSVISVTSKKENIYAHRTSSITIYTISNITILVTKGLYMETGFLDLLSSAKCAEITYNPAILHYNSDLLAEMSLQDPMQGSLEILEGPPYFKGTAIEDGSESASVGCSEKLGSINPCGIEYTAGTYCDPEIILKQKVAQHFMPASVFSGKLRLLIQAIYGSNRSDYEVPVDVFGVPIAPNILKIGDTIISSQFNPSWGLFTTLDYKYFLVKVGSDITYYPLVLNSAAQKIIEIIKNNPAINIETLKKAEAYALSTATIDTQNSLSSGSVNIIGSPLYYGLHWKWDGSEARAVCHEEDNVNQRYVARYYKLAITYDNVSNTFSHNLTILSNNYWWVNNGGLVGYRPKPSGSGMVAVPLVANTGGTFGGNPSTGNFNATIHVISGVDDQFVELTTSNSTVINNSTYLRNPGNPDADFAGCFDGRLYHLKEITYNGIQGNRTIHFGNKSLSVTYYSTSSERLEYSDGPVTYIGTSNPLGPFSNTDNSFWNVPMCNSQNLTDYLKSTPYFVNGGWGYATSQWDGNFTYNGIPNCRYEYRWYWLLHSRNFQREWYTAGRAKNGTLLFVIPHNSCSSVMVGKKQYEYNSVQDNNSRVEGGFWCQIKIHKIIVRPGGTILADLGPIMVGAFQYITPVLNYNYFIPANSTPATMSTIYDYSVVTPYASELISSEAPSTVRFFDVDWFEYPFLDLSETVKTATGNYYSYSSGYPIIPVSSDAGGYKHDSAIGWA